MFKWPIVKKHIIRYSLLPHLFYLAATVAFTSNLLHYRLNGVKKSDKGSQNFSSKASERWQWLLDSVVEEIMLIFATYFLSIELL